MPPTSINLLVHVSGDHSLQAASLTTGVGRGGIQVHAELYLWGLEPHDFVADGGAPLTSVRGGIAAR